MAGEHGCNLSFDGLRQRRAGTVAQNISQRIDKSSWLAELENISPDHASRRHFFWPLASWHEPPFDPAGSV
jgi:hypothetical protein